MVELTFDAASEDAEMRAAFDRASRDVLQMSSLYESTGNPVFLWNAIAAMTTPDLGTLRVVLPERVRMYLYEAAKGIRAAATERPSDFGQSVLQALKLSEGVKGSSVPKRYQKQQSAGLLLRAYSVLMFHYRYPKAEEVAAEQLGISGDALRLRLVEARSLLKEAATRLEAVGALPPGGLNFSASSEDLSLPIGMWLEVLKGMPDIRNRSTGRGRRS